MRDVKITTIREGAVEVEFRGVFASVYDAMRAADAFLVAAGGVSKREISSRDNGAWARAVAQARPVAEGNGYCDGA